MDIPVYLIAGFLDAGKTEFINGILRDGFAAEDHGAGRAERLAALADFPRNGRKHRARFPRAGNSIEKAGCGFLRRRGISQKF